MRTFLRIFLILSFLGCKNSIDKELNKLPAAASGSIAFDADGYYFPNDTIMLNGYQLDRLRIAIQDPKAPQVDVVLVDSSTGKETYVKASQSAIANERTVINFNNETLGDFKIAGHFLGVHGPANDNVDPLVTVVFKGDITLANGNAYPVELTWWEGD